MLKRFVLICLTTCLTSLASHAADEAKATPAQTPAATTKPNEAAGKIAAPEPKLVAAPKKKSKWSNPNLDLTHCLNRESNMEVIKCAH